MLENKEGQQIPSVTFKTREKGEWIDVTTDSLFKGKNVIVFSLPGAFTPTCSSAHLPRFNQLAKTFKKQGVDEIICLSVNDTFVMNEWKKDQEAKNITVIPDGNGEFTEQMGMLVDKKDLGFGKRSWRYSMYVKDGKIEKMFIEPEKPGDPFEVSDADTMLNYIAPNEPSPKQITLFTKEGCPFCNKAKKDLKEHGYEFEEIIVGKHTNSIGLSAVTGRNTVPQVFIDGKLIGTSEELEEFLKG